MIQSSPRALLLSDSLDQLIVNPTASHSWHYMAELYHEADPDLRMSALQFLLKHIPAEGIAGFFRATFLAAETADPACLAEAARIVQAIEPLDPGRLATFLGFEWARALYKSSDRPGFIQALRHARLHEITNRLGQYLSNGSGVRPVARDITKLGKVALVIPHISNAGHTPTAMALSRARLLIEHGIEVHLFACQELKVPQMAHYMGHREELLIPAPDTRQLRSIIPSTLTVTLGDERFSLMRRWTDMLKQIAAFDPDLVLFVGLYSPLVTPLYETRPVVGLCVHSVSPMAPVDVWLTAHRELADQCSREWGPDLPDAWGCYHPYRVELKPTGIPVARKDIGLPERARVLVTVGQRLPHEINGAWAVRMVELLRQHPDVLWLLVGGSGALPPALENAPLQQIRILPTHPDLRSVYRCCDIYVNPPRMGGGFSVAEAMAESLPVVAYVDSDGGHKVGAAAVNSDDDYFTLLRSLIRGPGLRARTGAAMHAHFANTLDVTQSGPSLLTAFDLALERYRQRTSRGFF